MMIEDRKNLIQYNGIMRCQSENMDYFKQFNKDFTVCIPSQKPEVEQIEAVWVNATIVTRKIIKTPQETSLEGQMLTGYKLMVTGDIQYKVEYTALNERKTVHTVSMLIPYCECIVLPEDSRVNDLVMIRVEIEDLFTEKLDARFIYNNLTMMIVADLD